MCDSANSPASETITAFILPDGSVVLETGKFGERSHAQAAAFVAQLQRALGASSRTDARLPRAHAHDHDHAHTHDHELLKAR